MEVNNHQQPRPHPSILRFEEAQADFARASRERVRRSRDEMAQGTEDRAEALRESRQQAQAHRVEEPAVDDRGVDRSRERQTLDRLELSSAARAAAEKANNPREALVQELRSQYETGELSSPERVERAAQRLLGA